MTKLNIWDKQYLENQIGWDIGYASPPLVFYFNQLENKDLRILIPGAGNAYEAEFLFKNGFKNIYILEISTIAIQKFKERVPEFPSENIINEDFFSYKGKYDLIVEQTFFSSFKPELRDKYAQKCKELLFAEGKLVGLLFGINFSETPPPYGGNKKEYQELFLKYFTKVQIENCYNSIKPRQGSEVFIIVWN